MNLDQECQSRVIQEGCEEVHVLVGVWSEAQWREIKRPLCLGVEALARQAERREGRPILYLLEDGSEKLYGKTAIVCMAEVRVCRLIGVGMRRDVGGQEDSTFTGWWDGMICFKYIRSSFHFSESSNRLQGSRFRRSRA